MRLLIILLSLLLFRPAMAAGNKTDKAVIKCFAEYIGNQNAKLKTNIRITRVSYGKVELKGIAINTGKKKGIIFWCNPNNYSMETGLLRQKLHNTHTVNCCLIFIDEEGNAVSYIVMESTQSYCIYRLISPGKLKLKKTIFKL